MSVDVACLAGADAAFVLDSLLPEVASAVSSGSLSPEKAAVIARSTRVMKLLLARCWQLLLLPLLKVRSVRPVNWQMLSLKILLLAENVYDVRNIYPFVKKATWCLGHLVF